MPIGKYESDNLHLVLGEPFAYFNQMGCSLQLERVTEAQLERIASSCHNQYQAVIDRANSDYLYKTSELIRLSGRKYCSKRNYIHQFNKRYTFRYEVLDTTILERAKDVLLAWYGEDRCGETLSFEREANMELLTHYPELGCQGALISVDGVHAALTVGERMDPKTAVIHLEKCDRGIQGLYQVLNQEFCRREWASSRRRWMSRPPCVLKRQRPKSTLLPIPIYFCLKITLKIGKKTQKEIAALIIIVIKSASVSPDPPIAFIK